VDEILSFVYAKEKNVATTKAALEGAGDIWTWTAIDADTKLIPSWYVGDRDAAAAQHFIGDLALRLAVGRGRLLCLSTPAGRRGFFYHAWIDQSEAWHREQVAATDCPRIDPVFLETQRAKIGHHHFMSEYCCTFLDAESQLFSGEHIAAALVDSECLPLHLVNEAKPPAWARPAAAADVATEAPGEAASY
jgi:hypothetical protein